MEKFLNDLARDTNSAPITDPRLIEQLSNLTVANKSNKEKSFQL